MKDQPQHSSEAGVKRISEEKAKKLSKPNKKPFLLETKAKGGAAFFDILAYIIH